jgi:hypothetical protein
MVYRGKFRRKHNYNEEVITAKNNAVPNLQLLKMPESVPLPNQSETENETQEERRTQDKLSRLLMRSFPFLEKLLKRIHLDDIILAGLIILLLDEGTEDYYLILILAYLLLSDLEIFDLIF